MNNQRMEEQGAEGVLAEAPCIHSARSVRSCTMPDGFLHPECALAALRDATTEWTDEDVGRWIRGRPKPADGANTVDRFWSYVQESDGCWLWQGFRSWNGYGRFKIGDRVVCAHRFAWELERGPVPDGLQLDHQCHNDDPSCNRGDDCPHRRCVRPDHLRAVTGAVNSRARTTNACIHGHPYDEENTRWAPNGYRTCRACARERAYRRYPEQKAATP